MKTMILDNHDQPSCTLYAVVVNDDPTQLNFLCGLLRKAGLEPRAFPRADDALAEMTARGGSLPALVVTDLYMPGIDGWRFCRLLRSPEYAAFNDVPILVVSATFGGDEPCRIASDIGAEAFLSSPVDGKRFIEQVRLILIGRQIPSPIRALIVTGEEAFAGLLKEALEGNGYRADTAFTARAAAQAFIETAFDVAVLDHRLPDGAGDDLLDAFRAQRPECDCLMMTADPRPELTLDWMKRGAAAHLRKPFDPGYIIELCACTRRERSLLRVQDLLEKRTRQLRKSEEKYRKLFESAPLGIFRTESNGRFLSINAAMAGLLGFNSPQEAMEYYSDLGSQLYIRAERRQELLGLLRERGFVEGFEYEARTVDGRSIWLSLNACAGDRREDGSFVIEGFTTDITERKRKEDDLRLKSLVLDQIQDQVTITDLEGVICYVNEAQVKKLGRPRDTLVGKSVSIFGDDSQKGATQREIVERTLRDGSWRGEVVNFAADGIELIMDCRTMLVYNAQGMPMALSGIATDITERKRDEESLRMAAEMLDAAPSAISIHDTEGRFLYANCKNFTLHRYSDKHEFMALNLHELDVPESRALIDERYRMIAEHGEASFEVSHFRKDGTEFPLEVFAKKVIWGGVPAVLSIATDITERKRAEEARRKLQEELDQAKKMESVGRLAGGVAHDFNNMLGVILGHAELAMTKMTREHPLYADLLEIHKAAERSADLTRQLLAFARKQAIALRALDLNETVERILKMIRRLIRENIDLRWLPAPGLWSVNMDPSQIDEILANLCMNAQNAIGDAGKVTIETKNIVLDETYCARHGGVVPGEYVLLAVRDDGCGMEKETLGRLFEPFFTQKEIGKGKGLGLSTVYGMVKQNDGFINVHSEPGRGTTFELYFPRHTAPVEQNKKESPPQPISHVRKTILLVEDEPAILRMTTQMIKKLGYTVLAAATPGEAIRLVKTHPGEIDLVITDVVMPEMNGRDLTKNLLPLRPDLKSLYMSGYTADVISRHGVLDDGVNFIQKPFTMRVLAAKIRKVLDIG